MGKLANVSGSSAKQISITLNQITEHLNTITESIFKANEVSEEYFKAIYSISKILDDIKDSYDSLK